MYVLLEWFQFEHIKTHCSVYVAQESGANTNGVSKQQSHISVAT